MPLLTLEGPGGSSHGGCGGTQPPCALSGTAERPLARTSSVKYLTARMGSGARNGAGTPRCQPRGRPRRGERATGFEPVTRMPHTPPVDRALTAADYVPPCALTKSRTPIHVAGEWRRRSTQDGPTLLRSRTNKKGGRYGVAMKDGILPAFGLASAVAVGFLAASCGRETIGPSSTAPRAALISSDPTGF